MVRWMAEHKIESPEKFRAFDQLGYRYHAELSAEGQLVFLANEKEGFYRKDWHFIMENAVIYIHGKGGTAEKASHYRPFFPD